MRYFGFETTVIGAGDALGTTVVDVDDVEEVELVDVVELDDVLDDVLDVDVVVVVGATFSVPTDTADV